MTKVYLSTVNDGSWGDASDTEVRLCVRELARRLEEAFPEVRVVIEAGSVPRWRVCDDERLAGEVLAFVNDAWEGVIDAVIP